MNMTRKIIAALLALNMMTGTALQAFAVEVQPELEVQQTIVEEELPPQQEETEDSPEQEEQPEEEEETQEGDTSEQPDQRPEWELLGLEESYSAKYGKSFQLEIDCGAELTYSSSDEEIAVVDETGCVTITGIGTAELTIVAAEDEEHRETAAVVTVEGKKLSQKVSVPESEIYTKRNADPFLLEVEAMEGAKLKYSSSDEAVVEVSKKGEVTPTGYGTAEITITASATEYYKKATCTVTVNVYYTPKKLEYSSSYKKSKYYKNLMALKLMGGTGTRIVTIAKSQVGYHEGQKETQLGGNGSGEGNYTEFGRYYGSNPDPWCAMFVNWCAREAGVSSKVIPKYAACASYYSFFHKSGQKFYSWAKIRKKEYTPKKGDIILFSYTKGGKSHHIGYIDSVSYTDSQVTIKTVEGNSSDEARKKTYKLDRSSGGKSGGMYIQGVAHPKY